MDLWLFAQYTSTWSRLGWMHDYNFLPKVLDIFVVYGVVMSDNFSFVP